MAVESVGGHARSRIASVLCLAWMATLLGGCGGEESPEASSPTSPASTSSTRSVAPSPQKIAPSPSMPTLRPGQCVAAPPSRRPTPTLDNDVCQAIVGYARDWTVVKAKVDPTPLSQAGTRLHGWFDSPSSAQPFGEASRFWSWKALFPVGVQESHQIFVFNPYGGVYGCGPQGVGRVVPTASVDREHGIIKVVIPSRCISVQGIDRAPRSIRASVNLDFIGTPDDGGAGRAYFTDPLFPGEVAVLRR